VEPVALLVQRLIPLVPSARGFILRCRYGVRAWRGRRVL
jgi:hypothetical protein